jgi:KEOPS complex subunit Cgi121
MYRFGLKMFVNPYFICYIGGKRMDKQIKNEMDLYYNNIQVGGFISNIIDLKQIMKDLNEYKDGCMIQLMDADGIAGREHVIHATIHAIKAFSRKENISKDMGLEICVRASGQRQISQALDMLGIKKGNINVCVVAVGCDGEVMEKLRFFLGERDDDVLEADEDKLKNIYSLSKIEVETAGSVSKILMERTALLILET